MEHESSVSSSVITFCFKKITYLCYKFYLNQQQLWEYIKDRRIDLIASDHSPSVASLKGPNFMTAWGGVSSVQFGTYLSDLVHNIRIIT